MLRGIELRSGTKGVFKISVDGEVAYDKAMTRRFPTGHELAESLEGRLGKKLGWRESDP